ncbi:MAG: hypothetical protein CL816_05675 [Coxiellaceae bacterium]|nr:hypothetical protein [Coxiellaceae bacterium]|tara:strand:+ start:7743 stop:8018 length:276 start_codon:yes stop_codon:yes gene_type:complete
MNINNMTTTIFTLLNYNNTINQTPNEQSKMHVGIEVILLISPMMVVAFCGICLSKGVWSHRNRHPTSLDEFERQVADGSDEESKSSAPLVL